jgi:glucose/mannose transport system substrate-binding protein
MRRTTRLSTAATAAAVALSLTACGGAGSSGGSGGDAAAAAGSGKLEVVSWWTSGSESAALDTLIAGFKAKDAGAEVINAAVSGGGGSNARQALATRLQGGDPPDSWQVHTDQDLAETVKDGSVADLTELYQQNGWEAQLPPQIAQTLKVDGKFYAVPVNAHRANVLWTNPAVMQKAGVTWNDSTTLDQFVADLPKVTAAGVTPLCLGDKDIFASSQLLESVLISRLGPDGWRGLFTGRTSFDSPQVRSAVQTYGTLLGAANTDHSALTWDQAVVNMTAGKCAANLMGDWAYGEMVNKGKKEGTDFAYLPFPGTSGTYDFVGDAFVIPAKNGPNPAAEKAWLSALFDPQVQKDFNLAKGSAPVRSDVPLDGFPTYQRGAVTSLRSDQIVSSLAHGQAAAGEFAQTYADAVSTFNGGPDVDAFVATLTAAQKKQLGQG